MFYLAWIICLIYFVGIIITNPIRNIIKAKNKQKQLNDLDKHIDKFVDILNRKTAEKKDIKK